MRSFFTVIKKHLFLSLSLVSLTVAPLFSADYLEPSFSPPGGLPPDSVPLFVVLGFDDNHYEDGMRWVLDLLKGKKNPVGTNNPLTFDNMPIGAGFYHTSDFLNEGNATLLATWKEARDDGYEVADHTMTHNTSKSTSLDNWRKEISGCRNELASKLSVPKESIIGFRTPYLDFNDATFSALGAEGFLYECTMQMMQEYTKTNFYWPYTLDNGFPKGCIQGWEGKCKVPGLWEIPVYALGEDATTMWPPICGFDSSILPNAAGPNYEKMMKNGIDYRLTATSNRCPMTLGLHSDTYSVKNAPNTITYMLDVPKRQAALKAFIEYALTKPMVRFVSAKQLIDWMRKPVPLGRPGVGIIETKSIQKTATISSVKMSAGSIDYNALSSGSQMVSIFDVQGKKLVEKRIEQKVGVNKVSLSGIDLSEGVMLVHFQSGETVTIRSIQ